MLIIGLLSLFLTLGEGLIYSNVIIIIGHKLLHLNAQSLSARISPPYCIILYNSVSFLPYCSGSLRESYSLPTIKARCLITSLPCCPISLMLLLFLAFPAYFIPESLLQTLLLHFSCISAVYYLLLLNMNIADLCPTFPQELKVALAPPFYPSIRTL